MTKFVAYYRVSTVEQGRSGLGLEAQQAAVEHTVNCHGTLLAEFREVESGKSDNNRPELSKALKRCRRSGATLIVAKLDRLSRNAAFLMTLRDSEVEFVCADMPDANKLTIGMMAVIAEHEREMISSRTKEALKAAKARGVSLGNPTDRRHEFTAEDRDRATVLRSEKAATFYHDRSEDLVAMREEGLSLRAMAKRLNDEGDKTPRGCQWTAAAVKRALAKV